jgi:hypothetical protein
VGVDQLAVRKGQCDRIDGEVAGVEICLDRPAAQRRDVDVPGAVARERTPRGKPLGEGEGRSPGGPRYRSSCRLLLPAHDEIDVEHRPPEQRVADRASHDPHVLPVTQRLARGANCGRGGEPILRLAHRWWMRGTRDAIPQVTS